MFRRPSLGDVVEKPSIALLPTSKLRRLSNADQVSRQQQNFFRRLLYALRGSTIVVPLWSSFIDPKCLLRLDTGVANA